MYYLLLAWQWSRLKIQTIAGTLVEWQGKLHKTRVGEWVDWGLFQTGNCSIVPRKERDILGNNRDEVTGRNKPGRLSCDVQPTLINNLLMSTAGINGRFGENASSSGYIPSWRGCSCYSYLLFVHVNRMVLVLASAAPLNTPASLKLICVLFPVGAYFGAHWCVWFHLSSTPHPKAHPSDNQVELSAKFQLTPCYETVTSSQCAAAD